MSNSSKSKSAASSTASANQPILPSQQKLLAIDVVRLKSLADVSLDFSLSPLTAIMGSNCSGKTTILHAIACGFRPLIKTSFDYKFPLFFRPNSDALWQGSNFTLRYAERVGEEDRPALSQNYSKLSDRWTPRYQRRPARSIRFVSIGESVPDIDTMTLTAMVHYEKTESVDATDQLVREVAGQVLNRDYESLYSVKYAYGGRLSIGVRTSSVTYSGLSMSSGEQRVFRLLRAVFGAPKYGLILIDEIDLFLHQDALQRLLKKLQDHCIQQKKQLIFTTHFPPVADMYDQMCVYTLHRAPEKTVVWRGYSYEAMRHITGTQERPISCYVEDDVAEQIISRVATLLGIRKFIEFGRYGPAINAFSLGAGLCLSNVTTTTTLVVLDGDVYGATKERQERVNSVMTGDQPHHKAQRTVLMRLVRTFALIKGPQGIALSPEQVLHRMMRGLDVTNVPPVYSEIHCIAMSVVNVPEKHGFVDQIIEHTGEPRMLALAKIVELASLSSEWPRYTRVVRVWLQKKKISLAL